MNEDDLLNVTHNWPKDLLYNQTLESFQQKAHYNFGKDVQNRNWPLVARNMFDCPGIQHQVLIFSITPM